MDVVLKKTDLLSSASPQAKPIPTESFKIEVDKDVDEVQPNIKPLVGVLRAKRATTPNGGSRPASREERGGALSEVAKRGRIDDEVLDIVGGGGKAGASRRHQTEADMSAGGSGGMGPNGKEASNEMERERYLRNIQLLSYKSISGRAAKHALPALITEGAFTATQMKQSQRPASRESGSRGGKRPSRSATATSTATKTEEDEGYGENEEAVIKSYGGEKHPFVSVADSNAAEDEDDNNDEEKDREGECQAKDGGSSGKAVVGDEGHAEERRAAPAPAESKDDDDSASVESDGSGSADAGVYAQPSVTIVQENAKSDTIFISSVGMNPPPPLAAAVAAVGRKAQRKLQMQMLKKPIQAQGKSVATKKPNLAPQRVTAISASTGLLLRPGSSSTNPGMSPVKEEASVMGSMTDEWFDATGRTSPGPPKDSPGGGSNKPSTPTIRGDGLPVDRESGAMDVLGSAKPVIENPLSKQHQSPPEPVVSVAKVVVSLTPTDDSNGFVSPHILASSGGDLETLSPMLPSTTATTTATTTTNTTNTTNNNNNIGSAPVTTACAADAYCTTMGPVRFSSEPVQRDDLMLLTQPGAGAGASRSPSPPNVLGAGVVRIPSPITGKVDADMRVKLVAAALDMDATANAALFCDDLDSALDICSGVANSYNRDGNKIDKDLDLLVMAHDMQASARRDEGGGEGEGGQHGGLMDRDLLLTSPIDASEEIVVKQLLRNRLMKHNSPGAKGKQYQLLRQTEVVSLSVLDQAVSMSGYMMEDGGGGGTLGSPNCGTGNYWARTESLATPKSYNREKKPYDDYTHRIVKAKTDLELLEMKKSAALIEQEKRVSAHITKQAETIGVDADTGTNADADDDADNADVAASSDPSSSNISIGEDICGGLQASMRRYKRASRSKLDTESQLILEREARRKEKAKARKQEDDARHKEWEKRFQRGWLSQPTPAPQSAAAIAATTAGGGETGFQLAFDDGSVHDGFSFAEVSISRLPETERVRLAATALSPSTDNNNNSAAGGGSYASISNHSNEGLLDPFHPLYHSSMESYYNADVSSNQSRRTSATDPLLRVRDDKLSYTYLASHDIKIANDAAHQQHQQQQSSPSLTAGSSYPVLGTAALETSNANAGVSHFLANAQSSNNADLMHAEFADSSVGVMDVGRGGSVAEKMRDSRLLGAYVADYTMENSQASSHGARANDRGKSRHRPGTTLAKELPRFTGRKLGESKPNQSLQQHEHTNMVHQQKQQVPGGCGRPVQKAKGIVEKGYRPDRSVMKPLVWNYDLMPDHIPRESQVALRKGGDLFRSTLAGSLIVEGHLEELSQAQLVVPSLQGMAPPKLDGWGTATSVKNTAAATPAAAAASTVGGSGGSNLSNGIRNSRSAPSLSQSGQLAIGGSRPP
jgi:hypothetical protein